MVRCGGRAPRPGDSSVTSPRGVTAPITTDRCDVEAGPRGPVTPASRPPSGSRRRPRRRYANREAGPRGPVTPGSRTRVGRDQRSRRSQRGRRTPPAAAALGRAGRSGVRSGDRGAVAKRGAQRSTLLNITWAGGWETKNRNVNAQRVRILRAPADHFFAMTLRNFKSPSAVPSLFGRLA
jgi:hypothetical protein